MSLLLRSLKQHATQNSHCCALRAQHESVSYRQLWDDVLHCSRYLQEQQVRVLAIALPNSIDWVIWDLACLQANITCVPVPWFFSAQQRQHLLRDAQVDSIVSEEGLTRIAAASDIVDDPVCKITYTSGSTGQPKGVCLTASALDTLSASLVDTLGDNLSRSHLSILPLSVLLENVAGVYPALVTGATVHLADSKAVLHDAGYLYRALHGTSANSTILVPELLRALIAAQSRASSTLKNLTYVAVGGARVGCGLLERAQKLALPVYEGYGLSECGSVVSVNTPQHHRMGTAGKLLPHVKASIRDGELMIHSPLASHYLHQPRFNTLATGDCARIDADSYLTITGRRKNLLITSWGRNINPEWIEAELAANENIRQAIVTGDAECSLSALIVADADVTEPSISNAIKHTNRELPGYAQIERWRRVAPFSNANGQLTGSGKPVRAAILNHYRDTHHDYTVL